MAGPLIGMLKRAVHIVLTFWPALLAWFLFGVLGRYVVIQVAGWIGASRFGLGLAVMPLAVLCRLIAFVAMLLVVRDALPNLRLTSPDPSEPRQRRREFLDALLAGILPFFAFYLAWRFFRDDMGAFYLRIDVVQKTRDLAVTSTGETIVPDAPGLSLTWITGVAIVVTYGFRRLLKRDASRSALGLRVIAVYFEALWVMLAGLVVTDLTTSITSWFRQRQGIVWMSKAREAMTIHVGPVDWLLTAGGWLIGEIGGVILLPLAWLTIAAVIYGTTLAPSSPAMRFLHRGRLVDIRERASRLPDWVRSRADDVWDSIVSGVRPIGDAFKLMWHAGPLLISVYVLLLRGVEWISGQLDVVLVHLIGPQTNDFWATYMPILVWAAPTLTAPLTIAVVAAAFDGVLGCVRPVDGCAAVTDGAPASSTAAP